MVVAGAADVGVVGQGQLALPARPPWLPVEAIFEDRLDRAVGAGADVENVASARSKAIDDVGHDYPVQKMSASAASAGSIVGTAGSGPAGGAAS